MNTMTKLISASVVTAGLLTAFATTVHAETSQTQSQEASQNLKVNCTAGAYGQSSTCSAEGNQTIKQSQTQYVYRNDGTVLAAHTTVNTGVESDVLAAGAATLVTSVTGMVLTLKKKIA